MLTIVGGAAVIEGASVEARVAATDGELVGLGMRDETSTETVARSCCVATRSAVAWGVPIRVAWVKLVAKRLGDWALGDLSRPDKEQMVQMKRKKSMAEAPPISRQTLLRLVGLTKSGDDLNERLWLTFTVGMSYLLATAIP